MPPLRWGIAGAGKITNDFVAALKISKDDHEVVAVASRSKDNAAAFAKKLDIPRAYGSYLELAKDDDVEIVYIGVINPQHLPVAEIMLEHKKNVLCEKPLGINYCQEQKMMKMAQANNVFLMEAIWSRFNPIYEKLKKEITSGNLGEIRQVMCHFGVKIDADRVNQRIHCGGGILDIGIYCLQFATWIFDDLEPNDLQIMGALNEDDVDQYASVNMRFGEKGIANFAYSISNDLENYAFVYGTKGTIKICEPFWTPTKMLINGTPFEIELRKSPYPFIYVNSASLKYEADHVKKCLNDGLLESPLVPHSASLLWAKLSDKIREKIGVKYEQEE